MGSLALKRNPPRIGFRADATALSGGGHVMRCLALAGALSARGADVTFFTIEDSLGTAPALERSGFRVVVLEDPRDDQLEAKLDAVVVDHYGLDARDEARLRRHAATVIVIDDLANRDHDCDVLVDTAPGRSAESYAAMAPGAKYLFGPGFALLRPVFASRRAESLRTQASPGPLRRILVSYGLSDPGEITTPTVNALMDIDESFRIDAAVRRGSAAWRSLEFVAAGSGGRLVLHDDPPEIADLMVQSDLVVGAGGITSWERCCLGLPSVVKQLVDNQADNVAALERTGAALVLRGRTDFVDEFRKAIERVSSEEVRRTMSRT
ncbi:MAG: UDP-2,4-diacetamido-2,4,6-trideoxy-beta-L-altropyranose hydrolase, partial [Brevundimonas sp.]